MPILSWYDDKDDKYLYDYLSFLKELSEVDDVRPFLMGCTKDNKIDIEKGRDLIRAYKE
jgi:TFIIF-interacting CTD phosphatase-like protein